MIDTLLVRKARAFAEDMLQKFPKEYVYHNISHTTEVAKAAEEIGSACKLDDDAIETVVVAAWLHDTGYFMNCDQHERISADTARQLLTGWGAQEQKIADIQRTILATTMPQNPKDIMGQVLCDADLAHLAKCDIIEHGKRLRNELSSIRNMNFDSDAAWLRFNISFFKAHSYFTEYGQQVLQPLKKKNLKILKQQLKALNGQNGFEDDAEEAESTKHKADKNGRTERGIETMFRTTSENHVTLSGMADTKANILISINSIILSIIVSVLFRKLEEYPQLLVPTLMLVATCLATIVLAILSTRPNVASGQFTREDIQQKKTNLLFFGNFHNVELKDYEWGMRQMMKDYDYLYGSMIKDIYFLGKVLSRKYKFLRLAYTIFMFGFVTSILAFLLAMMMNFHAYDFSKSFGL